MFFSFPEDARWNAGRQAVEFGVEIGEYRGVVRVPRRVFQRLLPERPTRERCVEAFYLQRTRFESIAEPKRRRRQVTEDGNVEISGRDLRKASGGNCAEERLKSRPFPDTRPGALSREPWQRLDFPKWGLSDFRRAAPSESAWSQNVETKSY
jgi:Protein of unknown function (DUF1488)